MIAEYTALFSDPKTLRAALNWYNGVMEAGIVACPPVLPGSPFEGNADFATMIKCVLHRFHGNTSHRESLALS
jgi:hypothetical protein